MTRLIFSTLLLFFFSSIVSASVTETGSSASTRTSTWYWYDEDGAAIRDGCDYTKWRICDEQEDCDTYDAWKALTFAGVNTRVPDWQSSHDIYTQYAHYQCRRPDAAMAMTRTRATPATTTTTTKTNMPTARTAGCPTKRCLPATVQSAYTCHLDAEDTTTTAECSPGEVCHPETNLCTACRHRSRPSSSSRSRSRGKEETTEPTTDAEDAEDVEAETAALQAAVYYAEGACTQPQTEGVHGAPPYHEQESGCAGDHCLHSCSYDTKCLRITQTTTVVDVTATHNQLPGTFSLVEETTTEEETRDATTATDLRTQLMRPSYCGKADAGRAEGGMRCATTIWKYITSRETTPTGSSRASSTPTMEKNGNEEEEEADDDDDDNLRDRTQVIVELSLKNTQNFITISTIDQNTKRVLQTPQDSEQDFVIGYNVVNVHNKGGETIQSTTDKATTKTNMFDAQGRTVGTGVLAEGAGLSSWDTQRRGLVQCDVKYMPDIALHNTSKTVSTFLTRVCVTKETTMLEKNTLIAWKQTIEDDNATNRNRKSAEEFIYFDTETTVCFPWGLTSSTTQRYYFTAKCSLSGPSNHVIAYDRIPSPTHKEQMKQRLVQAFHEGSLQLWDMLRVSFHDAAAYMPPSRVDDGATTPVGRHSIRGGARGCIRYEHVHGNAPNIGSAAFVIDTNFWNALGCQPGKDDYNNNIHYYQSGFDYINDRPNTNLSTKCITMADAVQFAGAVAADEASAGRTNLYNSLKWGRVDAPRLFCTGELQNYMPDSKGGHKEGTMKYGSSNIQQRLDTVYDTMKVYFEEQLGLTHQQWVAYLTGGHSVGGVRGLISARNTRFDFDPTPKKMDLLYLDRIQKASKTNLLSLCTQTKKPGPSYFFEPTYETIAKNKNVKETALTDTDVSLTTDDDTMDLVQNFRTNSTLFYELFEQAYVYVSELGYDDDSLITISNDDHDDSAAPTPIPTTTPNMSPTKGPSTVPTASPIGVRPIASPIVSHNDDCKDVQAKFRIYLKPNHQKLRQKNCRWVGKKNTHKRCDLFLQNKKKTVKKKCPETCNTCSSTCKDETNYRFQNKGKTCSKIAKLNHTNRQIFCNRKDTNKNTKRVKKFCPKTCRKC